MATRSFSLENLTNAIAEVQKGEGRSMRAVAQKYGSGPTVFTPDIEREIALTMHHTSRHGVWPYKRFGGGGNNDIPNPFTGGVPGRDWWQKRWPRLSERKPQHLS